MRRRTTAGQGSISSSTVFRYPDPQCSSLRAALAARFDVRPERLVFGAGSDELIALAAAAFLLAGDACVAPQPSFGRYRVSALLQGARLIEVPVAPDGVIDAGAMARASRGAVLVYAATPNNPTGGMLAAEALEQLVREVDDAALLVLDEAYFEFARAAGGPDGLRALAARRGPWAVLRTFSKAYGLAGLRVGYAVVSGAEIAEALNRSRGMFNVGVLAQAAALAALEDEAYMREQVARTAKARESLRASLAMLGIECLPSAANFLAARLPLPSARAVAELSRAGVLVAPLGDGPFSHYVRITIGSAADHARLIEALRGLKP
ncbi:MAG TPA: aminotransferase class I/II-fold pyridoxal phosphate-dependent enzyme [Gammaproteobacteria bacterium]|nr:aminotransferase class I/II-fold pyridoxal phosphate-dependent enzyme [Gammaproteobacteria bacterium]